MFIGRILFLSFLLFLLCASNTFASLEDGLVAYWSFDNCGATDDSGDGHSGTIDGNPQCVDGERGKAFSFNGITDYIHIPYSQDFDITPQGFTVAHWIKVDPSQEEDLWCTIDKSHGGPAWDQTGWAMQGSVSQNVLGFVIGDGSWWGGAGSGQIVDNQWHHVVGIFDGNNCKFYLDGIPTETIPFSGTPAANMRDLFIGKHYSLGRYFHGVIDEVRIYNRPLSESEIQGLYSGACTTPLSPILTIPTNGATGMSLTPALDWGNAGGATSYDVQVCTSSACTSVVQSANITESQWRVQTALSQNTLYYWRVKANNTCGSSEWSSSWSFRTGNQSCIPPPSGLVSWWPGDGNANDIVDSDHGVLEGGVVFGLGLVGEAFQLDGIDDYVMVSDSPNLDFGINDFTVDLWVKFSITDGEQVMVEKLIETLDENTRTGWTLTKLGNNVIRFAGPVADEGSILDVTPPSIPTNTWIFVAVTRTGNTFTLYWNGVAIGSATATVNLDATASLKIGHRGEPTDTPGSQDTRGMYLNGFIDEVEIFNRALSATEIQDILNASSAGKCKPGTTLRVYKTGSGSGTVTSSDSGINCGSICTRSYNSGTVVTLTAKAAEESEFTGWSGGGCSGTGTCVLAMNTDISVTAMFTLTQGTQWKPKISVRPMSVNLGSVRVGSISNSKTVTIKNTGNEDLIINSITITGLNQFEFMETNDCSIVPAKSSCPITVTFAPVLPFGKKSSAISISSNDPKKPIVNVKLSGKAPPPKISVSPKSVNFGLIKVDNTSTPRVVTIKNTGISDLEIGSITISGTNASEFSQTNTCTTISKGSSCTVTAAFSPVSAGSKSAVLSVSSNDLKKTVVNVKLTGKGTGTSGGGGGP